MVGVGALSLLLVLLAIKGALASELGTEGLTVSLGLFIGAALTSLLVWSAYAARRGQIPFWTSLLPGGNIGRLTDLARTFSLAACYSDDRAGQASLDTAFRNAVLAEQDRLRIPKKSRLDELTVDGLLALARIHPPWSSLVLLGAAAGKPALGLRRAVVRLEQQIERQRKLFIASCSICMMILAAATVLWVWWYSPFASLPLDLF